MKNLRIVIQFGDNPTDEDLRVIDVELKDHVNPRVWWDKYEEHLWLAFKQDQNVEDFTPSD